MDLLVCRPGFEDALRDEIAQRLGGKAVCLCPVPGMVEVRASVPLPPEFIFERRRMPDAGFIPDQLLKPVTAEQVRQMLGPALQGNLPWSICSFPAGSGTVGNLGPRVKGIEKAVLRVAREHFPETGRQMTDTQAGLLLQLCLTPRGLYHSCAALCLQAGSPLRMHQDSRAPSRSYLKLEEAFQLMNRQPRKNETAVDLGAAPGGWTYALIRRGCHVTAVDHGPMKLPPHEPGWGRVRHIRANGITFEPPRDLCPVDWLVSDMLVAPGVVLGLLRRWIGARRMRFFVCNIKIPQQNPCAAVKPLEDFLSAQRKVEFRLKQLYHDRREITIMGQLK
ncbi:MAG TPA: SAM-dependent methyltransferase [Kiritimatiellia bacterium]|nr:SAM-dependent methyltransferase [Kiritimatiellia bacterium]HQQ05252.1 SAM-dependent methyltransferase [Kiritimatiellia bacterium]